MAIPLNLKSNINDMQVGDAIACRYTASPNGVGFFSELGECVSTEIPVGGSSSPDGLFYFIHVGYDHKGRKKLVADRNIQHSISWDSLNAMGIAHGVSLNLESKLPKNMYLMGEGSGTVLNDAMKQANGTITGATWVDTPYGKGLSFNSNSYVDFPFKMIPVGKKSIRFKMLRSQAPDDDWERILTNGMVLNDAGIIVQVRPKTSVDPGSVEIIMTKGTSDSAYLFSIRSTFNVCDGKWHDVLFTWDGTTNENGVKLYVDNMNVPNAQRAANEVEIYEPTYNLKIGGQASTGVYSRYNGSITRLEIYNDVIDLSKRKSYASNVNLLEGGIDSQDTENEWDYIIGKNTLDGLITAGDNSIWNWSGIASWSSTIPNGAAANRVIRGNATALTHSNLASNTANATTGFRPLLLWEQLNQPPSTTTAIDNNIIFSNTSSIIGEITDIDDDPISYRVLINDEVFVDWTTPTEGPIEINIPLTLEIGVNIIQFEYTDGIYATQSWVDTVIKKDIDSFYDNGTNLIKCSTSLVVGGTNVTYIKIPAVSGYMKSAQLTLNILEGLEGTIKVAPITEDWDAVIVTTPPPIDVTKEVVLAYDGIPNEIIFDIAIEAAYGIAIYSEDTEIILDILGNAVAYEYWATTLYQPTEVIKDKVKFLWEPLILLGDSTYVKTVLVRDTLIDFSSKTTVAEITDEEVINYTENSVSNGTYYYMVEVYYDTAPAQFSNVVEVPVPEAGFRNLLIEGVYQLKIQQGIAFDDVATDYNFYTSPDGIIIRSLKTGELIGGTVSPVYPVEIINGYDDKDFDVTLTISQAGIRCEADNEYAYLNDASTRATKSKVGMSLNDLPFKSVYPLEFELNRDSKKIIYIKMYPTITKSVLSTFQINLSALSK